MSEIRTIEGEWWILGETELPHFGRATFDPETGLVLEVKKLGGYSLCESLSRFANGQIEKVPTVINGIDTRGRSITLFACCCDEHKVTPNFESYKISAVAGLLGEKVSQWRDAKFSAVSVHYSLFGDWLGEKLFDSAKTVDGRTSIVLKPDDESRIYELPKGVKLQFNSDSSMSHSSEKLQWNFEHRVFFHFPQETSIKEILDQHISSFRQFLTLLIGKAVFVEKVELFHRSPFDADNLAEYLSPVELLRGSHGISAAQKSVKHMIAPFQNLCGFSEIIRRWFELREKLEPVTDLYFGIVLQDPPLEARFLHLAQALEAYHSRCRDFSSADLPTAEHRQRVAAIVKSCPENYKEWVQQALAYANRKNLAQRFADIFGLFKEEVHILFRGIADVANRIRYTRNYLTHYDDGSKAKMLSEAEMFEATIGMEGLVQICILHELEITGNPVREILRRYGASTCVDLDSHSEQVKREGP